MRNIYLKIAGLLFIFLLNACNFPRPGNTVPVLDVNPDIAPTTEKVVTPVQDYESVECAFVWANDPLPELSEDFNRALKKIQKEAEGYAQA